MLLLWLLLIISLTGVFILYVIIIYGSFQVPPKPYAFIKTPLCAGIFNVNEWITEAQDTKDEILEAVARDLKDLIGPLSESKSKMMDGLEKLMHSKYSNTVDLKDGTLTSARLDNKKKLLAALKLRNQIEQEVPDGHTTPVDTASAADDDGDL